MIHRIDVETDTDARTGRSGSDPLGEAVRQQIVESGAAAGPVRTRRIFLIDTHATVEQVRRVADELLADPVVERADVISRDPSSSAPLPTAYSLLPADSSLIEIHLKPGVMDPVAASTEMAIRDMGLPVREVRTGRAYLIEAKLTRDDLQQIAARVLANGVIESIHFEPHIPEQFERGHEYRFHLKHIPLRDLTDQQLTRLSREGHLFLSLAEMKAIQAYFREQSREPTDIELETLAQTWSEHCVHKTLKSAVDLEVKDPSGKVIETRHYDNLIRDTIFASTMHLMEQAGSGQQAAGSQVKAASLLCLSVFKDNAGVIAFDDTDAVCFKVETHNHPSAIEPYGGSATGVGGVIRDILGTGLGARPVANTDVFCVAFPDAGTQIANRKSQIADLPKGVIHPKRILQQVVAGVRDYGNRMGIPTVNGAVYFDDRYIGNPLVFCGCVGIIPRDRIEKAARPGDAIVLMGGRTGRDGIHGATFSSAELTDTHADEFSHAVQIGNPITQKKMADVILQARDRSLYTAITDCGAGGLSSAVGEMGEKTGAQVDLETVPLKYAGLRYDEIWISEAQERMVLSVPREHVDELLTLAKSEDVEATVIGRYGTENEELILRYENNEVGRMAMHFLHNGIPMPRRKAVTVSRDTGVQPVPTALHGRKADATGNSLLQLLAHPNIASKHWIIRQYDHEVQGGSVIKPLTGPLQIGPSDAAVIRPKLHSYRGIAVACGLAPDIDDPYEMALASIDEAIGNAVSVGADPEKIAILDNFCWPSVDDEITMGSLVRACEACRDAALAYRIPFISGKDSLHNQFTNQETGEVIRIPNTLLISAIGVIKDVRRCVTMNLKHPGNHVYLIQPRAVSPRVEDPRLSSTRAATQLVAEARQTDAARTLDNRAAVHAAVAKAIRQKHILACHDISDGGLLVAAAEMCIASGIGLTIDGHDLDDDLFGRRIASYLVELAGPSQPDELARRLFDSADVRYVGAVGGETLKLRRNGKQEPLATIEHLTDTWRGTLDW
jgi:phosphoribosylformylglycinamidine synthase subunit PurSL